MSGRAIAIANGIGLSRHGRWTTQVVSPHLVVTRLSRTAMRLPRPTARRGASRAAIFGSLWYDAAGMALYVLLHVPDGAR
jgi:hypothetical protein